MAQDYDIAVIGLGAMGAAAAWRGAHRGARVIGLDARLPRHDEGSSHGATRATRQTYFESPDYVPLVRRAHDLWRALEAESGRALLTCNGALYLGPPGGGLTAGVRLAAERHRLPFEELDGPALKARFPGFAPPAGWEAAYEPNGGVLRAADCIDAMRAGARAQGADLIFGKAATGWRARSGGVDIETDNGPITAGAAIVTVGPWACGALADLNLPISARRIPIVHLKAARPGLYPASDLSVYFWATPEGVFAGFPDLPGEGVKIMRHDAGEVCTPETARRRADARDIAEIRAFARKYMPGADGPAARALIGLYTMTPDNHFIIDRHPTIGGLVYATGFSGHGFKFAPVIGEILTDMALDGASRHEIGFLGAGRFAQVFSPGI